MLKIINPILTQAMRDPSYDESIKGECMEILSEIFNRFSQLLLRQPSLVNKDDLMRIIPETLAHDKLAMRKKATNCIGAFSIIVNSKQLQQLCTLVVTKIKTARSKAEAQTMVTALGQISRQVGHKIYPFLPDIVPMVHQKAQCVQSGQSVDEDNEISEACLYVFESLIRKCPKDVGPYVK
jgi:cullin-associated NEDD8-dissociated protein 1